MTTPIPAAKFSKSYNERLFSGGLRKWVHEARFRWLQGELSRRSKAGEAIVEVGCMDCRSLHYIPPDFRSYIGFDADWEGGLTAALATLRHPRVTLRRCEAAGEFEPGTCEVVISLETMEHIEPSDLSGYFRKIAQALPDDGLVLISVPNETGPVFLGKQIYKALFLEGAREYTFEETVFQTLGLVEHVRRDEHKGFSWKHFLSELSLYLDVEKVAGLQVRFLPPSLNLSIGIVARKRRG